MHCLLQSGNKKFEAKIGCIDEQLKYYIWDSVPFCWKWWTDAPLPPPPPSLNFLQISGDQFLSKIYRAEHNSLHLVWKWRHVKIGSPTFIFFNYAPQSLCSQKNISWKISLHQVIPRCETRFSIHFTDELSR